jgi:hypothetical protein
MKVEEMGMHLAHTGDVRNTYKILDESLNGGDHFRKIAQMRG